VTGEQHWIPGDVSLERPSTARIYDFWLGGYHNFEADRKIGQAMADVYPDIRLTAQVNRAFLRRAVRFLVEQGIEQILDLGSGIPTVGNVHQVAQAINPNVRVAYVDIDPVAVAHSRAMLADNPLAVAILADVREPEVVLDNAEVRALLDWKEPLAVLMVAVLHYVHDDEEARRAVKVLREASAAGSYLVIAHVTEGYEAPGQVKLRQLFGQASKAVRRSRAKVEGFFEGYEIVDPGLVYAPLWRPDGPDDTFLDEPERAFALAGVGRQLSRV
jgi:hypothetical protein